MSSPYDVVINGGGPVGLGLAIELGQRGIRVCVVERYPEPQPIPKGQNLTQRTSEHFRAWGCEAELHSAHPIPKGGGIGGMTAYGTLLSDHTYDWLNRSNVKDYYFAPNARLPQYATERVLRARVAEIPEITVLYGWSGDALEMTDEGVRLTIAERNGDGRQVIDASYIVGCDGSRSFVREHAGISETLSDHNRLMALLVFRSEELHELLKRYPGKAFYNVLHPDYEGYWLFFGRVDHGLSWFFHAPVPIGTTTDNFDFRGLLHKAVGQEFALDLDYVGFWDLRVSLADSYRAGRAFIAGDAAHSHPPYGGYGINTGFEDARNLGWKLAATIKGWGNDALLDSYSAERQPVFASTARDFIENFIHEDREFLNNHSPDQGKDAFETAWKARAEGASGVEDFEPNYEGSPIVPGIGGTPSAKGSHSFVARAGHHLPPAGPEGRDVADVLGRDFTLLCADPSAAAAFLDAAYALNIPLTAPACHAAWFTPWDRRIVLVRPDGFVAWSGDTCPPDAAKAILSAAIGTGAAT
ncbi:MAG: FAD-dependent monooxygenase [Marivita sp.]|uniref:FAD-dependent monooxygenase n=1 Tax=Marivita sp. TaxID=2003365 RepID=UPI001B0CCFC4|nr:FAD-dependent monooxygenase [Marivita sp.]MBO6883125.1 FAD-dependent monooxygenase [Marivita sp.]